MLKKIIKTHTARLDYVDITPTFLRNAVATNRQRRVIASQSKLELLESCFGHQLSCAIFMNTGLRKVKEIAK